MPVSGIPLVLHIDQDGRDAEFPSLLCSLAKGKVCVVGSLFPLLLLIKKTCLKPLK